MRQTFGAHVAMFRELIDSFIRDDGRVDVKADGICVAPRCHYGVTIADRGTLVRRHRTETGSNDRKQMTAKID